jgi:hypothetical protein
MEQMGNLKPKSVLGEAGKGIETEFFQKNSVSDFVNSKIARRKYNDI